MLYRALTCINQIWVITLHDIHGWQTSQEVMAFGSSIYSQTLNYYTSNTPRYGGDVSSTVSSQFDQSPLVQAFSYDGLRRLIAVDGGYDKSISYDLNGNILSLTRTSSSSSDVNSTFLYDGNRMMRGIDNGSLAGMFSYDLSGKLYND